MHFGSQGESLAQSAQQSIDDKCRRFELELRENRQPRIEDFLSGVTNDSRQALFPRLLAAEIAVRRLGNEQPTPEHYVDRFPSYSEAIERVFAEALGAGSTKKNNFVESNISTLDPPPVGEVSTIEFTGRPPANSADTSAIGKSLGDYELLAELGRGGMGVVYRARQRRANRIVALKVIRPDRFSGYTSEQRLAAIERFRTEAQAAARIEHDNLVTIYDVGEIEGCPYFAMQYVAGHSLKELVDERPLENADAAEYLRQVAAGLQAAHAAGILHRDVKPANVMVDGESGRAMLTDFGLAKLHQSDQQLTATEAVLGSPPYMSPEQAVDASRVTQASDVYGLGATLYHVLTGRPPFQTARLLETLQQVQHSAPVAPRLLNPEVDRDLETITLKCLLKEPHRRYPSAGAVAAELQRYMDGEPIQARPVSHVERLWRWCRRRPAVAVPSAAAALLLVVALLSITWGYLSTSAALVNAEFHRKHAEGAQATAELERDVAKAAREGERLQTILANQKAEEAAQQKKIAEEQRDAAKKAEAGETQQKLLAMEKQHEAEAERDRAKRADAEAQKQKRIAEEQADAARKAEQVAERQRIAAEQQTKLALEAQAAESKQRKIAEQQRKAAETQKMKAEAQTELALKAQAAEALQRAEAERQTELAVAAKVEEARQRKIAEQQLLLAIRGTNNVQLNRARELLSRDRQQALDLLLDEQRCPAQLRDFTWRLLYRLASHEQTTLAGHEGEVYNVTYSPDGKLVATCGSDRAVRLWDVATRQLLHTYEGHAIGVYCVAFSPDGKILASGGGGLDHSKGIVVTPQVRQLPSAPGDVMLWSVDAPRRAIGKLTDHTGAVRAIAFSPNGQRLACGDMGHYFHDNRLFNKDGAVTLWDVGSQTRITRLRGHDSSVLTLSFSPNGKLLATAGANLAGAKASILLWNPASGQRVATLPGHEDRIWGVAFSPDGSRLASVSRHEHERQLHGELKVWNVAERKLAARLRATRGSSFYDLDYSPDGLTLVTTSYDDQVRFWNAGSGELQMSLKPLFGEVSRVALAPDNRSMVTVGDAVTLWNLQPQLKQRHLKPDKLSTSRIRFSHDGKLLATAGSNHLAKVFDWQSGQELVTLEKDDGDLRSLSFSHDDKLLAALVGYKKLGVWETETGRLVSSRDLDTLSALRIAFAPHDDLLAWSDGKGVNLWDIKDRQLRRKLSHDGLPIRDFAFTADGASLLATDSRRNIWLWDTATGDKRWTHRFRGLFDPQTPIVVSPDGARAAIGGGQYRSRGIGKGQEISGVIFVIDLASGEAQPLIEAHAAAVECLDFASDGKTMATYARDHTIRFWDVVTGQLRASFDSPKRPHRGFAISTMPDFLVEEFGDDLTRLLDPETGDIRRIPNRWSVETQQVYDIAFSPDGTSLALATLGGEIEIWPATTMTSENIASENIKDARDEEE